MLTEPQSGGFRVARRKSLIRYTVNLVFLCKLAQKRLFGRARLFAGLAGADTGGVDRVDIHPPFFSKKKIRNVTLFEIENKERKKN